MKKFIEEFKKFALRGNVMDMAVGVIIGGAFTGSLNILGLIVAIALLVGIVYMLFKPYKEATKLKTR